MLRQGCKQPAGVCVQGKVLTLGNFSTEKHWTRLALVLIVGAVPFGAHYAYTSMRDGRKRAKYQRALQEVEKMK